jgi:hypothetical protein
MHVVSVRTLFFALAIGQWWQERCTHHPLHNCSKYTDTGRSAGFVVEFRCVYGGWWVDAHEHPARHVADKIKFKQAHAGVTGVNRRLQKNRVYFVCCNSERTPNPLIIYQGASSGVNFDSECEITRLFVSQLCRFGTAAGGQGQGQGRITLTGH